MNGSNRGVIGFNPEQVTKLLNEINNSCSRSEMFIATVFDELGKLIFGFEDSMGGWYSPEAVQYEKNIYYPTQERLRSTVAKVYKTVYGDIVSIARAWNQATGSTVTFAGDVFINGKPGWGLHAKETDKDGNIRIAPTLISLIKDFKNGTIYTSYFNDLHDSIALCKRYTAFLGDNQQRSVATQLDELEKKLISELAAFMTTTIAEMQKAIEKYQAIAKQVASSFNKTN